MHGMYGQHTTQRSNFHQQQKTENLGLNEGSLTACNPESTGDSTI